MGTNQWLDGQYLSSTPPSAPNEVKNIDGIATIYYVPGYGIAVYDSVEGRPTGKYLQHGTKWKIFKLQKVGDSYCLMSVVTDGLMAIM